MDDNRIFTIGHSNRTIGAFISLLKEFEITALADVRSRPYSRRCPQFNKGVLKDELVRKGIDYVFLGRELGARRNEAECYDGETARYDLIAKSPSFCSGLDRIRKGLRTHRIALMCTERDPLACHRTILICRQFKSEAPITHILDHDQSEEHFDAEMRLLKMVGLPLNDLFRSVDELVALAYAIQGDKIAYRSTQGTASSHTGDD